MSKSVDKKKIVLEFESNNIFVLDSYAKFISKHLKEGNKVPSRVLNKFFSLFTIEEHRMKEEFKKQVDIIKKQTLDRFLTDKKYSFSKMLPNQYHIIELFGPNRNNFGDIDCNLTDMLNHVFLDIEKKLEIRQQSAFIQLLNSSINKYFSAFEGDTKDLLKSYSRNAIIGFIAYKFGFQLSNEIRESNDIEPTNEMLHQAIRYHTSKKKQVIKAAFI
jgi:hypothetical protein